MLCVLLILLPSIVPPSVSTGCSQCSTKSPAWKALRRGYPPYNIKQSGENAYNISVAVAGFADADLSIEVKENTLTIRGNKQSSDDEESANLIYQGIAERVILRSQASSSPTTTQLGARGWRTDFCRFTSCGWSLEAMKPRAIPRTTAKKPP